MRAEFLPFSPPCLGPEEVAAVEEVLRSGWITRGPRTAAFEEAFARRVGAGAALGLNSCTAGLHLALRGLEVGPGHEVIAPTMTFAASVNVIEHVGARPVLVDVEPDTLNIDPDAVREALTERTRAITVVHYGGHPAEMDALEAVAEEAGVPIVEDAAHALPAVYRGRTIGSADRLTAFSFYATKNLTTGEGGMLTGPEEMVDRLRPLGLHGMSEAAWNRYSPEGSWFYDVVAPGFKYNMTDLQAALGMVQLERLDAMQERRGRIVERYRRELGGLDGLELPAHRPWTEHAWHLFPVRLREGGAQARAAFIEHMRARRIGVSVHFIPIHYHTFYREKYGYRTGDFPVAEDAFDRCLSLPLHPGLADPDVDDVVEAVVAFVRQR